MTTKELSRKDNGIEIPVNPLNECRVKHSSYERLENKRFLFKSAQFSVLTFSYGLFILLTYATKRPYKGGIKKHFGGRTAI